MTVLTVFHKRHLPRPPNNQILHQHSIESVPMHVSEIADFDYPAAFSSLDLDAVKVSPFLC